MSGLVLNGIDLGSIAAFNGIARLGREPVGEVRQAFGGGERRDLSAAKRGWRVKTITLPAATAEALRVLTEGDDEERTCDVLSFDTDTWSARGVPVSAISSGVVVSTAADIYGFGGKGLYDNGNRLSSAEWAGIVKAGSPWTVLGWRNDGPGFGTIHHYALTSTGLLYRDGVLNSSVPACWAIDANGKLTINARDKQESLPTFQATHVYVVGNRISVVVSGNVYIFQVTVAGTSGGSAPTWPTTYNATVSSGSPAVTWRNDGRGGIFVDDVAVLPFVPPAAWLPGMYNFHSSPHGGGGATGVDSFGWVAPELIATGSLVGTVPAFAKVRAKFTSSRAVKTRAYGNQSEQLDFELMEV